MLLTVARERMVLRIPLCRRHYWRYRFARLFGRSLLLGAFPATVGWFVLTEDEFGMWVVFFSMLVVGMSLLILCGRPLRTLFINSEYGCFFGAGDAFLLHFPARHQHNPGAASTGAPTFGL